MLLWQQTIGLRSGRPKTGKRGHGFGNLYPQGTSHSPNENCVCIPWNFTQAKIETKVAWNENVATQQGLEEEAQREARNTARKHLDRCVSGLSAHKKVHGEIVSRASRTCKDPNAVHVMQCM